MVQCFKFLLKTNVGSDKLINNQNYFFKIMCFGLGFCNSCYPIKYVISPKHFYGKI